jgi:hypothetical protein
MGDWDMTALLDYLNELDRLVNVARKGRIQSETFVAELRDAMGKVAALLKGTPNDLFNKFLNADSNLLKAIAAYKEHPTLLGVSEIGKMVSRYRTAATS